MTADNIALAHQVIDAVEFRELEKLLELSDPEVEWRSAFAVSKGEDGYYRGLDGLRSYIADMNDAWDIVRLEVDHELCVGEVVLFIGRIHYRGKGSGAEGQTESGYMLKFRAGKLLRFRPFKDPERALEEVGLGSA